MSCSRCASWSTQLQFSAEVLIHFPGLKNLDKPAVFVFPELSVCPDCGFTWFTTAKPELELLQIGLQRDVPACA